MGITWLMDLLLSFPTLLFSIALLSVFSLIPSFLGLSGTPLRFAVIIFVLGSSASRTSGASSAVRCCPCAKRSSWMPRAASAPRTSAS
jgi:ABC-type dipeptide/oligopeptide/nickel transport system permease subunit